MPSNTQLIDAMRTAPEPWMDVAVVVAFEDRFEFVAEDHPDPMYWLSFLQEQGGLAIGLAGVKPDNSTDRAFLFELFQEYEGEVWAHQDMERLRDENKTSLLAQTGEVISRRLRA